MTAIIEWQLRSKSFKWRKLKKYFNLMQSQNHKITCKNEIATCYSQCIYFASDDYFFIAPCVSILLREKITWHFSPYFWQKLIRMIAIVGCITNPTTQTKKKKTHTRASMARKKKCAWLVKEENILFEHRSYLFRQSSERNIDLVVFETLMNARKQIFSYLLQHASELLANKSIDASSSPHRITDKDVCARNIA